MATQASARTRDSAAALGFDRMGSGPPLVLVHGLGSERHVWAPIVERIADRREVVAVDLPGFGDSEPLAGPGPPSPAALAEAIAGLVAELGLGRPHVAGNSLGGWVALELAKAGRVASVTAIAPAGLWPAPLGPKPYVMRHVAQTLRPALPALLASERVRGFALGASVGHPERVPREAAVRMALAYAEAPGFEAVNDAMRSGHFTGGERIRVPVTIGWCELDRLVGRPRIMPLRAREVRLAGCGHVPMYDDPDAVARLVLEGSEPRTGPTSR